MALNKFISSGEIEELNDVLPNKDEKLAKVNEDDGDDNECDDDSKFDPKRLCYDHNVQLIYDKDNSVQPTFIPPLMALNVQVDTNGIQDQDFRNNAININNGDRDDRDLWQNNQPNSNKQWGGSTIAANPFSVNLNNNVGGGIVNNKPPSLLNISIEPPDMSPPDSNWGANGRSRGDNFGNRNRDDKGRRRDSDGRRISRFDNNENRNRRANNDYDSASGVNGRNRIRNKRRS